jgi:hypothetical protein
MFLLVGPEEYRRSDALGQPPVEWQPSTLEAVTRGCEQILRYRGLTPDRPLPTSARLAHRMRLDPKAATYAELVVARKRIARRPRRRDSSG